MKIPSIEKIELAIMNSSLFNFRQNLMVFRVSDFSQIINHECDCLIMSKAGYLTEIEIKRSYADFLADFKKNHEHQDPHIKEFFFLVHESFAEKVCAKLLEIKHIPTAIFSYDDNAEISLYKGRYLLHSEIGYHDTNWFYYANTLNPKKLFLEEQFQLARLGAMRYKTMTQNLIKLKEKEEEQ